MFSKVIPSNQGNAFLEFATIFSKTRIPFSKFLHDIILCVYSIILIHDIPISLVGIHCILNTITVCLVYTCFKAILLRVTFA